MHGTTFERNRSLGFLAGDVGGARGVYEVIMDNVKMVNLNISRVKEIQYQIDTIQFIALKSAS